ncbi:MAG: hypothetical protein PW788_04165 [Micavibrio sp.]|nr:hypothetical protein [Micavibrio sp.]
MKTLRPMNETLRYKSMVTNLKSRPHYAKEAALLKEIAAGKQWRIDAVIEAIETNRYDWNYINFTNVMKQAAMFGRLATMEKLCDLRGYKVGADVAQGPVQAAFHVASLHSHYKVADALLQRGAGPDYMADDRTPAAIHFAIKETNLRKIDYLVKNGQNKDYAAYLAASDGNMKALRHMVEKHGAGVNFASEGFWTPFLAAVKHRRDDIAEYVLAKGATPWLDKSAGEALYTAVGDDNEKMVRRMLGLGMKPGAQDLQHAIFEGKLKAARILLAEAGVDVNIGKGEVVMLAVASKNPIEAFKLCLEFGGNAERALANLKADAEMYKYGNRAKMIEILENYVPPATKPQAKGPSL